MFSRCLILTVALVVLCAAQIQSQPQESVRAYQSGLRKLKRSDLDGAISDFTRAIQVNSGFNPNAIASVSAQLSASALETNSAVARATVIDPFIAELYSSRGVARFRKGDFKGAIADWDRAIYINPRLASAFNNRAVAQHSLGNKSDALRDWTHTIEIDSQFAVAYTNRGAARLELNDITGALADLNRAIVLDAAGAVPHSHRGYVWIAAYNAHLKVDDLISSDFSKVGFVERSLADFDWAIELYPTLADAYSGRAIVETLQNKFYKAISDFTYSLKLNPNQPNTYLNRGLVLMILGKTQEAEADFALCLSLAPDKGEELKHRKELTKELIAKPQEGSH